MPVVVVEDVEEQVELLQVKVETVVEDAVSTGNGNPGTANTGGGGGGGELAGAKWWFRSSCS